MRSRASRPLDALRFLPATARRTHRIPIFVLGLAVAVALALFSPRPAGAVSFSSVASLVGTEAAAVAWGDYDNDGDLDLVVAGNEATNTRATRLYRNDGGGVFTQVAAGFVGVWFAALAWGDYDLDGDLDLVLFGKDQADNSRGILYRNDAGVFVDSGTPLTALQSAAARWGDLDNDGDPDLIAIGQTTTSSTSATTCVYRNDGGVLTLVPTSLPDLASDTPSGISLDLGDIDGDGDLDLALDARSASGSTNRVYRNDAGTWTDTGAPLVNVIYGSIALGDADADGDLDLVVIGQSGVAVAKVYTNNGTGTFAETFSGNTAGYLGGVAWADADGDGDLDFVEWGGAPSGAMAALATNTAGSFSFAAAGLPPMPNTGWAWGDYDADGDPDLVVTGYNLATGGHTTRIYANAGGPANAASAAPGGLSASFVPGPKGARATFAWTRPTDDHTPQLGLSYELRIGTTPGGSQVTGTVANPATGFRRVARFGQLGSRTSWTLDLPPGTYYWSVQAVDGAMRGGPFAGEQELIIPPLSIDGAALTGVMGIAGGNRPSLTWADYDLDGDLDLLAIGGTAASGVSGSANLYRNDAGALVPVATAIPGLTAAATAWGDYDRDGDPDLVVSGMNTSGVRVTQLLRNDAGTLVAAGSSLPGVAIGALAWGDADNDGDLDLFLAGSPTGVATDGIARIYLNSGGTFTDGGFGLEGSTFSSAAWADFDRDGDLDLVINGINPSNVRKTNVYRNDGGSFALLTTLAGLSGGNVVVGQLDENGTPDIVLNGTTASPGAESGGQTKVYLTDPTGTVFTEAGLALPGGFAGSVALGDYDADGDLDFAWSGSLTSGFRKTYLVRNTAGAFAVADSNLTPVRYGALAWADVDGDGRLDLALAGSTTGTVASPTGPITQLYRNVGARTNAPPAPPTINAAFPDGNKLRVWWTSPADDATPAYRLTYDVMLGTTYKGGEIAPLTGLVPSGERTTVRGGDWKETIAYHLDGLAPGVYYVRVQAVDASFAGSSLEGWVGFSYNVTGVGEGPGGPLTGRLELSPVRPNPMAAQARIDFELPRAADVDLVVFDVAGRKVRTLLKDRMAAGRQVALWDGADGDGRRAPAGVYFVQLAADGETRSQRVVVAR